MNWYLAIDQYGEKYTLNTKFPRKALLEQLNATHADKIYVDDKDGNAKHIGYIISGLWLRLYNVSEWTGKTEQ